MFLNDIDPSFIKCISYLHSNDSLIKGETVPLQIFLEEAIKNKSGIAKDLTNVVSSSIKQLRVEEYKPFINVIEETKTSNSDNELELDLLKEDLMCIICNEMDVGARNRLIECSDCHSLYHQECHKPIVTIQDSFDTWVCQNCKDISKKTKVINTTNSSVALNGKIASKPNSSSTHRHSSSSSSTTTTSSSSYKPIGVPSKSDKFKSSTSTSSKLSNVSTKIPNNTLIISRTNVTPNINIISADKRIQIMKKKAAKMQEKRKHLSR